MTKVYTVYVKDNSEDDSDRRRIDDCEDCASAIAYCKRIVDRSLSELDANQSAEQLFDLYCLFGEDAWIITDDPACKFSAWDYAKEQCRELAAKK
jgi:hypothetical protein